jgi:hypothetical protein
MTNKWADRSWWSSLTKEVQSTLPENIMNAQELDRYMTNAQKSHDQVAKSITEYERKKSDMELAKQAVQEVRGYRPDTVWNKMSDATEVQNLLKGETKEGDPFMKRLHELQATNGIVPAIKVEEDSYWDQMLLALGNIRGEDYTKESETNPSIDNLTELGTERARLALEQAITDSKRDRVSGAYMNNIELLRSDASEKIADLTTQLQNKDGKYTNTDLQKGERDLAYWKAVDAEFRTDRSKDIMKEVISTDEEKIEESVGGKKFPWSFVLIMGGILLVGGGLYFYAKKA